MKQWMAYLGVVFIKLKLKESAILPEQGDKLWEDLSIYLLVCYSFMYEYDILQSIYRINTDNILTRFIMKQIQYH